MDIGSASAALAIVTFGSWFVFFLFWMIMARGTKRNIHEQPVGGKIAYFLPTLLGAWLVAGFPEHWRPFASLAPRIVPVSLGVSVASAVIAVLGVSLAIWARVALGRNWSARVTVKQDHALVTSGPYRWIRHPIYTALIMLFFSVFLLFGMLGGALGMVLVILGCWIKLRQEEALMVAEFPQTYPAYRARTARLVPFLV